VRRGRERGKEARSRRRDEEGRNENIPSSSVLGFASSSSSSSSSSPGFKPAASHADF